MNSMLETLCLMFDGNLNMPTEITYSKVWFALEHPKVLFHLLCLFLFYFIYTSYVFILY